MKSNLKNRRSVVAMTLSLLILPMLAEAQDQCAPVIIGISGFNPKESGVLKLADECEAQGHVVRKVVLTLPTNVLEIFRDVILKRIVEFVTKKEIETKTKVSEILNQKLKDIKAEIAMDLEACPNRPLHIICHSWGCPFGLRLASDLQKGININGKKESVNVETMILLDPIKLGFPIRFPQVRGSFLVTSNVQKVFVFRQTWDIGPLVGDRDVKIEDRQKTSVVGNFHLPRRSRNLRGQERELLMAMREEFRENNPQNPGKHNLTRGKLHNFADDSRVLRELAFSSVNHPCAEPPSPPPAPPPPHCSGPLSGDWNVLTTTASSHMCTNVDCGVPPCRCETTNTEGPIIIAGSLIALGPLGVCHEGNTLTGEWHPNPQQTVTLQGTVEPRGRPGILDDHVSFAHEFRTDLDCGQLHIFVVGDGTVTDDSGLAGTPNIEGNWQRNDKFFLSCELCPVPGNLRHDCVSSGSFETLIIPPSMQQSGSTGSLDIGTWRKKLTQGYNKLGLDRKCTRKSKTSALDSASVSH